MNQESAMLTTALPANTDPVTVYVDDQSLFGPPNRTASTQKTAWFSIDGELLSGARQSYTDRFVSATRGIYSGIGQPHSVGAIVREVPWALYYLPSESDAPDISPDFDDSWTHTGDAERVAMSETQQDTVFVEQEVTKEQGVSPVRILLKQYISSALPGGLWIWSDGGNNIAGQWDWAVRCRESNAVCDLYPKAILRVFRDGACIYSVSSAHPTEAPTDQLRGRERSAAPTLARVNTLAGDRLVLEVGLTSSTAASTNDRKGYMEFGDAAENAWVQESATTQDNPYLVILSYEDISRFDTNDAGWAYTAPRAPTHRPSRIAFPRVVPADTGKLNQMVLNQRKNNVN